MPDKKIYIAITLTGDLARMFAELKQARELGNNSEFTRSLLTYALKAQLKKVKAK